MSAWRTVPDTNGRCEVSDRGLVRSVISRADGSVERTVLSPSVNGGYLFVSVYILRGKRVTRAIHRLVLEAFVGPRPEGMECRHLNGVPSDNRLANLRWGSHQQNIDDKRAHGSHARRPLTDAQVAMVAKWHAILPQSDIAALCDCNPRTIRRTLKRLLSKDSA